MGLFSGNNQKVSNQAAPQEPSKASATAEERAKETAKRAYMMNYFHLALLQREGALTNEDFKDIVTHNQKTLHVCEAPAIKQFNEELIKDNTRTFTDASQLLIKEIRKQLGDVQPKIERISPYIKEDILKDDLNILRDELIVLAVFIRTQCLVNILDVTEADGIEFNVMDNVRRELGLDYYGQYVKYKEHWILEIAHVNNPLSSLANEIVQRTRHRLQHKAVHQTSPFFATILTDLAIKNAYAFWPLVLASKQS